MDGLSVDRQGGEERVEVGEHVEVNGGNGTTHTGNTTISKVL